MYKRMHRSGENKLEAGKEEKNGENRKQCCEIGKNSEIVLLKLYRNRVTQPVNKKIRKQLVFLKKIRNCRKKGISFSGKAEEQEKN